MAKKLDTNKYVDVSFLQSTLLGNNPVSRKLNELINEHEIVGNLTWAKLKSIDKDFAKEVKSFVTDNKDRLESKYTQFGANREKQIISAQIKKAKKKPAKRKVQIKTAEQKYSEARVLLNEDVGKLSKRQINSIITYADLDFKDIEPYYNRLKYLKSEPVNYNKPQSNKAAKALFTSNFAGKANPMKWIDFDEIIKAKLYGVKMGIKFLEKEDPKGLEEVLSLTEETIDSILTKLGYKTINEIKF